jgi:hypothetical protein
VFVVDWKALNTPLGLPGQRQAICTRTFFLPLLEGLAPKDPEIHYYATSLAPHQADAAKLAGLIRGHWGIENRLHHVKDRTFLEDRHWVKNSATAYVLAFLRSLTVGLLHTLEIPGRAGRAYCPEKIEYIQRDFARALRLVCGEK